MNERKRSSEELQHDSFTSERLPYDIDYIAYIYTMYITVYSVFRCYVLSDIHINEFISATLQSRFQLQV